MAKQRKEPDLPFDLNLLIAANGREMQNFYILQPDERQRLLNKISKTNERIREQQNTTS